jgi:hypothetical protein
VRRIEEGSGMLIKPKSNPNRVVVGGYSQDAKVWAILIGVVIGGAGFRGKFLA